MSVATARPLPPIFAACRAAGRLAIIPFVTAGYPDLATTERVLLGADAAGADIVEIGFPFSDPIADGPVIAESMTVALRGGITPGAIFDLVARVRGRVRAALVAMVTYSIVHRIGAEAFARRAADCGFDALIVPDLDVDASTALRAVAARTGLALVLLAAPTSPADRIRRIASDSTGFVYMLGRVGVTGGGGDLGDLGAGVRRLRAVTDLPIAVGFGVRGAEDVRRVAASGADGAIVGSAIVQSMTGGDGDAASGALRLVRELAGARAWGREMTDVLRIAAGSCRVLFAFDVAKSVELDDALRVLGADAGRGTETAASRASRQFRFEYQAPPVACSFPIAPIEIGDHRTTDHVEMAVYDFGAVTVEFAIPLAGDVAALIPLAEKLHDNAILRDQARRSMVELVDRLGSAVTRREIAPFVEEYCIWHLAALEAERVPALLPQEHGELIARLLRAEPGPLSPQEVADALERGISYAPGDLLVIDWNAALLVDPDPGAIPAVLRFANVELLELRMLDERLDWDMSRFSRLLNRRSPLRAIGLGMGDMSRDLRRLAEAQIDSVLLFEEVNNALKLLGDQYLARVYRLASRRFHLEEWDASILRKLAAMEGMYGKLVERQNARRIEVLEWIVIILIALEILLAGWGIGRVAP